MRARCRLNHLRIRFAACPRSSRMRAPAGPKESYCGFSVRSGRCASGGSCQRRPSTSSRRKHLLVGPTHIAQARGPLQSLAVCETDCRHDCRAPRSFKHCRRPLQAMGGWQNFHAATHGSGAPRVHHRCRGAPRCTKSSISSMKSVQSIIGATHRP